jgi:hypothetical protein
LSVLIWLPSNVREQQRDELIRRGKLAAEVLDKSSIGALTVDDRGALNQLAKGFIRSKDFLFILILDKDGKLLADSGLEPPDASMLEKHLTLVHQSDADTQTEMRWPSTEEPVISFSRPVFYEQLRIGTIVLGISARRLNLQTELLKMQLLLLCGGLFVLGAGLAFYFGWSYSSPLRKIVSGLGNLPDTDLEKLAGKSKELNLIVEGLVKQKNLFQGSLSELEVQKQQLEAQLADSTKEASDLSLSLGSMTKQIEGLQQRIRTMEEQSRHLTRIAPLVDFATGIAPEIDTSMQHISRSAEQLSEDLGRIRNLINLYDRALPQTPEDLAVISQYKSFIQYERIKETMEELVTTIRGGATWSEQLADLLKQLSSGHATQSQ